LNSFIRLDSDSYPNDDRGRRSRYCMVVGVTACVISAYYY